MRIPARPTLAAAIVAAAALFAAGCTAPGAGLLERPPDDLPASIHYLPGGSLGWIVFDTDVERDAWGAIADATGIEADAAMGAFAEALHAPADDAGALDPWIGDAAGAAVTSHELDTDEAVVLFADVDDRAAAEAWLGDAGWSRADSFDHLLGDGVAGEMEAWAHGAHGTGRGFTWIALAEDALVAVRSQEALEATVESADEYVASERKATNEFTVTALQRSPIAFVFRSDEVREHLRIAVSGDPARLELVRWITSMSVLDALRDGWVGVVPPTKAGDDGVRLVGEADWLEELSPDGPLEVVGPDVLATMPATSQVAVAMHDPGRLVQDLVASATRNGVEFATPEADGDAPQLSGITDGLDGDAAIGTAPLCGPPGRGTVARVEDVRAPDVVTSLERAIGGFGVGRFGATLDDSTLLAGWPTSDEPSGRQTLALACDDALELVGTAKPLGEDEAYTSAIAAAGAAGTPVVARVWADLDPCTQAPTRLPVAGPVAGAVGYRDNRLHYAFSVETPRHVTCLRPSGGSSAVGR